MTDKTRCTACNGTGRWRGMFGGPDWPLCTRCNGSGEEDGFPDADLGQRAMIDRNKLIAVVKQFADPANWYSRVGCEQWMGKRSAQEYAAEVLKDVMSG